MNSNSNARFWKSLWNPKPDWVGEALAKRVLLAGRMRNLAGFLRQVCHLLGGGLLKPQARENKDWKVGSGLQRKILLHRILRSANPVHAEPQNLTPERTALVEAMSRNIRNGRRKIYRIDLYAHTFAHIGREYRGQPLQQRDAQKILTVGGKYIA